jgi:hypothetical protein
VRSRLLRADSSGHPLSQRQKTVCGSNAVPSVGAAAPWQLLRRVSPPPQTGDDVTDPHPRTAHGPPSATPVRTSPAKATLCDDLSANDRSGTTRVKSWPEDVLRRWVSADHGRRATNCNVTVTIPRCPSGKSDGALRALHRRWRVRGGVCSRLCLRRRRGLPQLVPLLSLLRRKGRHRILAAPVLVDGDGARDRDRPCREAAGARVTTGRGQERRPVWPGPHGALSTLAPRGSPLRAGDAAEELHCAFERLRQGRAIDPALDC